MFSNWLTTNYTIWPHINKAMKWPCAAVNLTKTFINEVCCDKFSFAFLKTNSVYPWRWLDVLWAWIKLDSQRGREDTKQVHRLWRHQASDFGGMSRTFLNPKISPRYRVKFAFLLKFWGAEALVWGAKPPPPVMAPLSCSPCNPWGMPHCQIRSP